MSTPGLLAERTMRKVLRDTEPGARVLDVGCGPNRMHADRFEEQGYDVVTVDRRRGDADYFEEFTGALRGRIASDYEPFDVVWCSHVLEHAPNVRLFLQHASQLVATNGWLAITVPTNDRTRLLGGHLNAFTGPRALYHIVTAGIDCAEAGYCTWGWECGVVIGPGIPRVPNDVLNTLPMDNGDLEMLEPYFPIPIKQGYVQQSDMEVRW